MCCRLKQTHCKKYTHNTSKSIAYIYYTIIYKDMQLFSGIKSKGVLLWKEKTKKQNQ